MPTTSLIEVSKLSLDLKNFRTVPQKKEANAIKAMIAISPDRFYAIMESLVEDGYIPTENIIVLKQGTVNIVKEGNRRIACLKLIHRHYKLNDFGIPASTIEKIESLSPTWKKENQSVPCTVFTASESDKADKVVALAHGKGERASREGWSSVATARHNRDAKGIAEPALDLLEKYLKHTDNISDQLKEIWAGDYPLTVLHEAIRYIHGRLGFDHFADLVSKYPKNVQPHHLNNLVRDIGLKQVQFKTIRNIDDDFAIHYGVKPIEQNVTKGTNNTGDGVSNQTSKNSSNKSNLKTTSASRTVIPKAYAANDPKHIAYLLKYFIPRGDRSKVVTLRDEIKKLKIKDHPIAFCFLLRSMFEISTKKYCLENRIPIKKIGKDGKLQQDRSLAELLKEVYKNLISNDTDKSRTKILHGAYTEITKSEGILSVTSMNNLVHNPAFSVQPPDICTLFGNIFPLLESMN